MKKKILILSHAMELGGAERSLLGLLDSLDLDKAEIDLFLLRHQGELMDMIPEGINLLPAVPAYTVLARPMKDTLREGHFLLTVARLVGNICAKLYARLHRHTDSGVALDYSHKFTCPLMPKIQPEKEYDLAISFLTPHYFVARKVKAKKKLAWIHTDYKTVQVDIPSETKMWDAYDYIASISDAVTQSFLEIFPSLYKKLVLIENIMPARLIMQQAEMLAPENEMPKKGIRLLSIGRYCTAKNFDNIPDICARLMREGLDVYWYIIGYGGTEELIRQRIRESGMEERVILLGKKENPYPYIQACDLYVQPSRYEGKCVAVREAQMLCKPVVITNYATASSQLEDGVDGIIVPMDNESCATEIAALLRDPQKMEQLAGNCRLRDYTEKRETAKIYGILS